MALITNSILGQIAGSIGGITFYQSKSGQAARLRLKPCKAFSDSLKNAQTFLPRSINKWNSLSAVQKGLWNSWAYPNYYSLRAKNESPRTGVQAYRGCQMNCMMGNNKQIDPIFSRLPIGSGLTNVVSWYVAPNTPVGLRVVGQIYSTALISYPIRFATAVLSSAGLFLFELDWLASQPGGLLQGTFKDANGMTAGLRFYISEPGKSAGFVARNYLRSVLFDTGILNFNAPALTGAYLMSMTATVPSIIANKKISYRTGDWVYITAAMIGSNGTSVLLGRLNIPIT